MKRFAAKTVLSALLLGPTMLPNAAGGIPFESSSTPPQIALTCLLAFFAAFVGTAIVFYFILRRSLSISEMAIQAAMRLVAHQSDLQQPGSSPISNPQGSKAVTGATSPQPIESSPTSGSERLPRVVLSRALIPQICAEVSKDLRKHGANMETGGMLIGEFLDAQPQQVPVLRITGFVGAGPKADLSPSSIQFDNEYMTRMLQAFRLEHPRLGNMGCIHRHPGRMSECSDGDRLADQRAVLESDTKALLFAIITIDNPDQTPLSISHENFRFDFYLMSHQTGFEYVRVRPELEDIPVLQVPRALDAFSEQRGVSGILDLAVLRRCGELADATLVAFETPEGPGQLLTAGINGRQERLRILCLSGGAMRVIVGDREGGHRELHGPWERPEAGKHIWLSHVVHLAMARLHSDNESVAFDRHFAGLLQDKHRLCIEVRAMRERYGDRAILRSTGNQLFWEYTVHESGRRFPVHIVYPPTYPAEPPDIISLKPLPPSTHQLGDNRLCWIDQFTGSAPWNPSRDTAAVCVSAAHRWFACLLVYLTTGRWPDGAD